MRLAVIGTGYVGLVAGVCFAEAGHHVTCIDLDAARIATLREGRVPFFEPGLGDALAAQPSRLSFDTTLRAPAEVVFLTTAASLTEPEALVPLVASLPRGIEVVVIKSTVAVGTADSLAARFPEVHFVSNPEFLREGSALADFRSPDRVVIGSTSPAASQRVASLFMNAKNVIFTDSRSAELSKLAANAMLAARISLINELARLSDTLHADVHEVRRVLAADPRIGNAFLDAGVGFGGSCLPKDLHALAAHSPLFAEVEAANVRARTELLNTARDHFAGALRGKRIALWGLAFKPNTDDTREAPSLAIANALLDEGAIVIAFDPVARPSLDSRIVIATSALAAATDADALIIVTEWDEFSRVELSELRQRMKTPVIFDGRHVFDPHDATSHGFTWYGSGRNALTTRRR